MRSGVNKAYCGVGRDGQSVHARVQTVCRAAVVGASLYGGMLFAVVYGRVCYALRLDFWKFINHADYILAGRVWLAAVMLGVLPSVCAGIAVVVAGTEQTTAAWAMVVLTGALAAAIQSLSLASSVAVWPQAALGAVTAALLYPAMCRVLAHERAMTRSRWMVLCCVLALNSPFLYFYLLAAVPVAWRWLNVCINAYGG